MEYLFKALNILLFWSQFVAVTGNYCELSGVSIFVLGEVT